MTYLPVAGLTAVTTILGAVYFTRSMHIFQLNAYQAGLQLRWLAKNLHKLYFGVRAKAKKPLVFTHRVIRMCVSAAVVFALAAYLLIVAGFFYLLPLLFVLSPLFPIIANFINIPVEKLNNRRYINQAKRIIDGSSGLTAIGVTGSYGKTSVKYYLHKLLTVKYVTLMTPESYNTTLGVVKTIRESLRPTHEFFICEMGAKGRGEIKEICDIVHPKHSVITSIGPQHLESFKTIDNIISAKFEIADCITDGKVFLNYDNEYIRNRKTDKNIVTYGVFSDADYKAENVTVSEKGTTFTVTVKATGEKQSFTTKLLGVHNVQNITAAVAVAHTFGVKLKEMTLPIKRLETAPHRLQIISNGGNTVIDDAFNSNPSGAKAALDVLKLFDGFKILITPGMVELGSEERGLNREFGRQAAVSCDYAVLIGENRALPIKEGLITEGFDANRIKISPSFKEGMEFIGALDSGGKKKVVLIENDLPDNY